MADPSHRGGAWGSGKIRSVNASRRTDRKTLGWALGLAFALLLKAAVPMLAVAAADAQGKALFEVCSAYGVRTVAPDRQAGQPAPLEHPAGAAAHGGEHCALAGLLVLAAPGCSGAVAPAAASQAGGRLALRAAAPPPDAAADWAARLQHGPPASS